MPVPFALGDLLIKYVHGPLLPRIYVPAAKVVSSLHSFFGGYNRYDGIDLLMLHYFSSKAYSRAVDPNLETHFDPIIPY